MSLQKGLVYNPQHCSLLVLSSNCSAGGEQADHHHHNTDKDAQAIFSVLKESGVVRDSMARLVTTSEGATKQGLKEAIHEQLAKVTSDEEGLFIFVYCGGVCDLQDHGLAFRVSESEDFMVKCTHSLVLKNFDPQAVETYVSGGHIANIILSSSTKPKQMLVILDCPCAQEVSQDLEKHLNDQLECDLTVMVSQGTGKTSHFLRPLGTSTFSYFFSKFLSEESAKTVAGTHATLYLKSMYAKVSLCCEALSTLRMVRNGLKLMPAMATPEARFVHMIEKAQEVMERLDQTDGDQVDYQEEGTVGKFLQKYYKSGFFTSRVFLCDQAKDWVLAVMQGPLVKLVEQGELKDKVLLAAVGSMMFSVATIQSELKCDSISNSNIFVQAYIYVFAAVAMHLHDLHISDPLLLKEAVECYTEVLRAKKLSEREMNQIREKLEKQ